jgi:AbrB family looped-hinge helix DNA binding protein
VWHDPFIMDKVATSLKVPVGPQGRLVIPSELRRELGISPGDVLVASVDGERLVLERREGVLGRLRRRFAHLPAGVSLADELIAERRAESRQET